MLVQNEITEVERIMVAQAEEYNLDFKAALDLILSSGGKRIRPTITLLVGKALGGDVTRLITLAAAIEFPMVFGGNSAYRQFYFLPCGSIGSTGRFASRNEVVW